MKNWKKLCMTDDSVSSLTKVENFVSTIDVGGLFWSVAVKQYKTDREELESMIG